MLNKICCVKVLDLLYHCKSLIMQLLYCDTLEFNVLSEKHDLLKNKFKGIYFSTLNSYNFDKVNTNLIESECKSLKELIKRKDLVIQKLTKATL